MPGTVSCVYSRKFKGSTSCAEVGIVDICRCVGGSLRGLDRTGRGGDGAVGRRFPRFGPGFAHLPGKGLGLLSQDEDRQTGLFRKGCRAATTAFLCRPCPEIGPAGHWMGSCERQPVGRDGSREGQAARDSPCQVRGKLPVANLRSHSSGARSGQHHGSSPLRDPARNPRPIRIRIRRPRPPDGIERTGGPPPPSVPARSLAGKPAGRRRLASVMLWLLLLAMILSLILW